METKLKEVMDTMNYNLDNPELEEKISPDVIILNVARQNVTNIKDIEQICLYGSMSSDEKAVELSQTFLKEAREKNVGDVAKSM